MGYIEEIQEEVGECLSGEVGYRKSKNGNTDVCLSYIFMAMSRGDNPYEVTAEITMAIPPDNPEYELWRMLKIVADKYEAHCGTELLVSHLTQLLEHYTPSAQTDEPPL